MFYSYPRICADSDNLLTQYFTLLTRTHLLSWRSRLKLADIRLHWRDGTRSSMILLDSFASQTVCQLQYEIEVRMPCKHFSTQGAFSFESISVDLFYAMFKSILCDMHPVIRVCRISKPTEYSRDQADSNTSKISSIIKRMCTEEHCGHLFRGQLEYL